MAANTDADILAFVSSVTGDLSPAHGTSIEELQKAHLAAINAYKTGQRLSIASDNQSSAASLSDIDSLSVMDLLNEASTTPMANIRVQRRVATMNFPMEPHAPATGSGGQVISESLGPFIDSVRRPILVDVLTSIPLIGLQWLRTAQPFLYISLTQLTGMSKEIILDSGSIWIPTSEFAVGAPDSSFVGLSIQSGRIDFEIPINLDARPISIPSFTLVQVSLKLRPIASDPGFHFQAITPENIRLIFNATGGSLAASDNAMINAFGSSTYFAPQPGSASYAMEFSRIEFPFRSLSDSFFFGQSVSQMVKFSGKPAVDSAQWFLPIIITSPDALGETDGVGGLSLRLDRGITADIKKAQLSIDCGPSSLLIEPRRLIISSQLARARNVPRLLPSDPKSTILFRTPGAFPFLYVMQNDATEGFSVSAFITATLDQPRNLSNERGRFSSSGYVIVVRKQSITTTEYFGTSPFPREKVAPQSYAIKNLLIGSSQPLSLRTIITEADGLPPKGSSTVDFDMRFAVPILPDPYTSSSPLSLPDSRMSRSIGTFRLLLSWESSGQPALEITIVPPPADATRTQVASDVIVTAFNRTLTNVSRTSRLFLLDLSTNVSQFGVSIGGGTAERAINPPITSISDLTFNITGSLVKVVTLPAVQWEPVYSPTPMVTADGTPFPNPLTYANSGQPTELSSNAVDLVPLSPREALDGLVSRYNSDEKSEISTQFNLPFGIEATASIVHSSVPIIESPSLATVQPNFHSVSMTGADQLSLTGSRHRIGLPPHRFASRSFPGWAYQLRNARDGNGNLTNVTAISSENTDIITDSFNQAFGPGKDTARVPVTRIDISGFGESMFSDWRSVDDSEGIAISKVQFGVLVGRTAQEIVQLTSVLYPFAARVVRTITIHRLNTGVVVREDSGWSAASDGNYSFPNSPAVTQPIITHPGVVKSVTNINNIRDLDLSHPVTVSGGVELVGVRFNCFVEIENTVLGQSPKGTPSRDMLGFVQKTSGPPLNAVQYQELLSQVGVLGGLVDCTINIGGSGQLMRVNQVGVCASQSGTDIQFSVAGWGVPIFPGGGQWSFLAAKGNDLAPTAVSPSGVPLIQRNPIGAPPAQQPYRFAEPGDLLTVTTQSTNYCLCHGTGTQKILFPNPVIALKVPWAITSTVPPFLADPYALGTSTGPFPAFLTCIQFNDANYQLLIGPNGSLRLQLQPNSSANSFTPAKVRRILQVSDTYRSVAFNGDENGNPSNVTVSLDTSNPVPWSLEITNLSLISEIPSMGEGNPDPHTSEVTRIVGAVRSAANLKTEIAEKPRVVFGPALQPVKDALSFFEQFGALLPMTISMTNHWSIWIQLSVDLDKLLKKAGLPSGVVGFLKKFIEKLSLDIDIIQHTDTSFSYSRYKYGMRLKFPLVGIWVITFIGAFEYYTGSDGKNYTLQIGGGVGADLTFPGGFVAFAAIEVTVVGIMGDHTWGIGGSVIISAHIDYKVVSVQVSVEARHMYMVTDCTTLRGKGQTKWGLTQLLVAIDIHIFWVIDIDYHSTSEWKANYNGGPCPMEINANTKNAGTPS